jgi:hypothetical protein
MADQRRAGPALFGRAAEVPPLTADITAGDFTLTDARRYAHDRHFARALPRRAEPPGQPGSTDNIGDYR